MPRTVFVGDVHGCFAELRELVEEKIRPAAGDRVILLGDLINRGPDTAGAVRYVRERGFACVMGNHEERYLRKFETHDWARDIRAALSDADHAWIAALPAFLEGENFIAVHGGLTPGEHPSETLAKPDGLTALTKTRSVRADGSWTDEHEVPGGEPWWARYRGDKTVVYGHWAQQGLKVAGKTVGLDSGCVFGRELSAYVLETGELLRVRARATHLDWRK